MSQTAPTQAQAQTPALSLGPLVGIEVLSCFHLLKTACTAKCGSVLPCLTGNDLSCSCSCLAFCSSSSFSCTPILPPLTSCFLLLSSALSLMIYSPLLFLHHPLLNMLSDLWCDSEDPGLYCTTTSGSL